MRKKVLQFRNVSFGYQQLPIFQSLQFDVYEGEFIGIIGRSGSGKSTLLRLITGLEEPTSGEIYLNGEISNSRFGKTGYMPQKDLLMPWRTIRENARIPLELRGIPKSRANKEVDLLLDAFGLSNCGDLYPDELSGGMRQRVSFLRATLSGSKLLLLDEPFSALDAFTKLNMQEWLLKQWSKQKQAILFITHDVSEALYLCDRIFILTEQPITKMEEIHVPLNRPRSRQDLTNPKILALQEQLIQRFYMGSI